MTVNLESSKKELNSWKKKGRKLLHSLLPARIAIQIENGATPNSISEVTSQQQQQQQQQQQSRKLKHLCNLCVYAFTVV